eukprot:gene9502-12801_t
MSNHLECIKHISSASSLTAILENIADASRQSQCHSVSDQRESKKFRNRRNYVNPYAFVTTIKTGVFVNQFSGVKTNITRVFVKTSDSGKLSTVGWILATELNDCMNCFYKFGLFNTKHHCRCCGNLVCTSCTRTAGIREVIDIGTVLICIKCHNTQNLGIVSIVDVNNAINDVESCVHSIQYVATGPLHDDYLSNIGTGYGMILPSMNISRSMRNQSVNGNGQIMRLLAALHSNEQKLNSSSVSLIHQTRRSFSPIPIPVENNTNNSVNKPDVFAGSYKASMRLKAALSDNMNKLDIIEEMTRQSSDNNSCITMDTRSSGQHDRGPCGR